MYTVLHPCRFFTLAVLPWTLCQEPVPIQFQVSPVLVATGGDAVFTLQTISNIFSITWMAPGGGTLGQWIGSQAVLNPLALYQGRVNISATQLRISTSRLSDAGNYTVSVTPAAPTVLATNSHSVALRVFDAVSPVSLFVPSVAMEGGNVSLSCTWAKGTETSVAWSKGGASLLSDPHISVNAGSLIINPASRTDAGQYSCTVSNPVSAQTATETLTVYYGPDPPQVNKTSSDCVGGGDVTVGQAAQLTCTSVSFPPAFLSWQYNGQSLTASQSTSGSLSLQIFSTNQSGKYVCLASNSITTKTSQQELSLSVVGSCLSVGAVAGIVIACFVALVLIIAAIVLLVRQRKADRRLRTVIGRQNKNLNAGPMVISAPQNGHVNPEFTGGDQPGPPIHAGLSRPTNQQNAPTIWQNNKENNAAMTQNRATNTSAVQHNNYPNGTTLSNGANPTSGTVPSNGQRNSNLNPWTNSHNPDSFPRNPNILIQTGGGEPGAQTVLINLNPLNTQPQAVQVSLNAPQSASGQPNQIQPANASQFNLNGIQHERSNRSQQNPPRYPSGRTRTENAHSGLLRNDPQEPSDPYQPPYFTNQTPTSRHTGTACAHTEPLHANQTRSRAGYHLDANAEPRQMPWDRMCGTPAYPNFQVESDRGSSQTSSSLDRSPDSERRRTASTQRRRRSADGQVRNVPRASRRDLLRQLAQSAAHRRPRTDQSAPRQAVQPRAAGPPQQIQNPLVQTGTNPTMAAPQMAITPQRQTVQTQPSEPTNIANRASLGQRDSAPPNDYPNLVPLTQAALRQHTSQTPSPFLSRIHQTQAALQHPGTQPRNAETLPAGQINRQGQVAPTLPPVLQPNEFRTLPRETLQKPPTQQPVLVMKRPGVVHHGHRPPNMHRNTRTARANLHTHPGNPHKQMNVPRHPAHMDQIHRSRPKP